TTTHQWRREPTTKPYERQMRPTSTTPPSTAMTAQHDTPPTATTAQHQHPPTVTTAQPHPTNGEHGPLHPPPPTMRMARQM
ncbi:hypothetical protein K443DRAFT_114338, partial [Laccaria amethystina LaAM-08-1]